MNPFVDLAASAVGDAIAERQEAVSKVDIFKFYIRRRAGQLHIGKVPKAPDTKIDQMSGCVLSDRLGNGQHDYIHVVGMNEVIQLGHGIHRHAVDDGAGELRVDIKGGVYSETGLGEGKILQQGMTQVAHSDHDEMMIIVHAQDMADLRTKLFHIVAVALLTELAEAAEILSDLGSSDIHFLSQGVGRDPHHAPGTEVRQLSVVTGEAPDDGVGDILLFQCDHSYKHEPQGSLKIS